MSAPITDPYKRRRLLYYWRRYGKAYEEVRDWDDSVDQFDMSEAIGRSRELAALCRARHRYLVALAWANIFGPNDVAPDDDMLWEINPIGAPREDWYNRP